MKATSKYYVRIGRYFFFLATGKTGWCTDCRRFYSIPPSADVECQAVDFKDTDPVHFRTALWTKEDQETPAFDMSSMWWKAHGVSPIILGKSFIVQSNHPRKTNLSKARNGDEPNITVPDLALHVIQWPPFFLQRLVRLIISCLAKSLKQ